MRLVWDSFALADRRAIYDHIEPEDPRAAVRIDERLSGAVTRLNDFPHSGRPGRVDGTRELDVGGTPYIVAYRVEPDRVRLLRVLHGAQRWPHELEGDRPAQSLVDRGMNFVDALHSRADPTEATPADRGFIDSLYEDHPPERNSGTAWPIDALWRRRGGGMGRRAL